MTDSIADGFLEVGEPAQSLGTGEGEDVSGPKESFGFCVVGFAGGEKADGSLGPTLCLCDSEILGCEFGERIDDWIFGNESILHDPEYHLDR